MTLASIVIVALLAPGGAAIATTPSSLLADVQTYYANTKQLTAQFEQTVTYAAYGTSQNSTGVVMLAKPDKMRWDYAGKKKGPARKSFIFDGKTLWIVEPSNLMATKSAASNGMLPAALSFLTGSAKLTNDFEITLATKSPHGVTVLELAPKQPSAQYKQLFFVVAKDGHVEKSIVIDSSDNTNEFRFSAIDAKTPIKTTLFTFDPKRVPTYKIIDANAPTTP